MFPKTTVSTPLSVIIFTGRPFSHSTFTGTTGTHKRHRDNNYSYHRVQNSYQLFRKPWLDTIFLLYMSSLTTLAHTIAEVILFRSVLILMLQNYKTNCLDISSTGSFPFPMSMDTHIHIPYHPYGDGDSTWI